MSAACSWGLIVIEISRCHTYDVHTYICIYGLSCMQPYKVDYLDKNDMQSIHSSYGSLASKRNFSTRIHIQCT